MTERTSGPEVEILMPERFRHHHIASAAVSSRQILPRHGEGMDLYGLRKDGTEFPLEIALNPVDEDDKGLVLASIVDITARRRIEAEKNSSAWNWPDRTPIWRNSLTSLA